MAKQKLKAGKTEEEKEIIIGKRFAVQFDLTYKGSDGIKPDPKSETQPDMNLTVRQLLANHTRGVTGNIHEKDPLYFDIQIPAINDITDVEAYREALKTQVEKIDLFIKEELEEKAKQEAAEKAAAEKPKQTSIEDEDQQQQ